MKKFSLNSKGLTMIELVFSLALGSVVVLTALGFLGLTQSQQKKLLTSTSSMVLTPIEKQTLCYWHGDKEGDEQSFCIRANEANDAALSCNITEKAKKFKKQITQQLQEASKLGFPKDFFSKEKELEIEPECRFINKSRTMYLSRAYLLVKDFGLKSETVAECAKYVPKQAQEKFDKGAARLQSKIESTVKALSEVDDNDNKKRKELEQALQRLQEKAGELVTELNKTMQNCPYLRLSVVFEVKSFKRAVPKDKDARKKFLAATPHKLDFVPLWLEAFESGCQEGATKEWHLQLVDAHNWHPRVWEVNSQGCSVPLERRFWVGEDEEGEESFTLATKDNDKRVGHLLKGVGGTFGGVFHRAIDDHETLRFSTLKKAYEGQVLASRGKRGGWFSNWGKPGDDCHKKANSGQKFPDSLKHNMHTGQKSFSTRVLPCPDGFKASPIIFDRSKFEMVEEHSPADPCHQVMFVCVPDQGCPSGCLDSKSHTYLEWPCINARVTGQCDLADEGAPPVSTCPDRYIQDAHARCAEITD